ncbi:MAG: NAD(P)-dependent oxidoreductase [Ignavibacteriales bacterium]|nr:NAD(P)-dependent oxidoreductase [Ignavibacteriales bacterium]
MKNVAKKLTAREYEINFAELHPAFTPNAAVVEANRCLYCYDSPCTQACPTHIDIPTFIKKISTGNLKGSAKTILESNWIALTCAKACPVKVLCEGACVYNEKGEEPIRIGRLQRHAMDWFYDHKTPPLFAPAPRNGKSVGIIGAGPAGLACAAELALLGYEVTIYEAKNKAGGLDTWGIAPYKMMQKDSMKEVKFIKSLGVKIKTNTRVGKDVALKQLERKHVAIFIGAGLGRPTSLHIPGEKLKGVVDALDFIERVTPRQWHRVDVGKRVAVIGAGNTAIDAATEAKRLGAEEVYLIYRRSEKEMPAYDFEFELAKSDGIQFYFQTAPKRILGKTVVEGIECIKMRLGKPDAEGRRRPEPIPRSEFRLAVDMVIKSVGQNIEETFLAKIPNLETNDGMVVVKSESYQTTNSKYFAGGDCINGGKEVVNAAHDGKAAAQGMDQFFNEQ